MKKHNSDSSSQITVVNPLFRNNGNVANGNHVNIDVKRKTNVDKAETTINPVYGKTIIISNHSYSSVEGANAIERYKSSKNPNAIRKEKSNNEFHSSERDMITPTSPSLKKSRSDDLLEELNTISIESSRIFINNAKNEQLSENMQQMKIEHLERRIAFLKSEIKRRNSVIEENRLLKLRLKELQTV